MQVTVLGTSASYPGFGQACSGFLAQEDGVNLLVDCGTGVLSNLQRFLDLRDVSDIFISHMHADHFIDLIPYRYALRFGLNGQQHSRPRLYLPPGGIDVLKRVAAPFSETDNFFADVFEMSEYEPRGSLQIRDLMLKFAPVSHYIPSHAVSIQSSRKIVYSSDSALCPELSQIAKDADLFLCNVGRSLIPDRDSLWGHLRPSEAGTLAKQANVKRLLLCHFWPSSDRVLSLKEACQTFGGAAELAESCATFKI